MAWSGWSTLQESKWGAGNSPDIYFQWQYRYDRSGADMIYQIWCRVRKPSGSYGYNIYFNCYMDNAWKCGGYLKNSSTSSWSYYPSESGYYSDAFTISNKTSGTTALKFNVYSPNAGTSRSTDFTQSMTVTAAGSDITVAPRGTSYILGDSNAGANISLTRYSSSFADILTYTANGSSAINLTNITSGGSTTYEWSTIPLELAQYNTTGTTIPIVVTTTTKTNSSGSVIQSKTASFDATIPNTSSTRPTVTLNISDPSDFVNTFGGYIQGVTSVEVVASGTRKYGAEITPNITIDGTSYVPAVEYDGDSVECARQTKITTNTGTRTITATFTDSRGFTASTSSNITVLPYSNPTITYVEAQRCTGASDPTPKGDGAYALLKFKGNITTFNQSGYTENEIGYALSYQIDDGTEQTVTNFSTDSSGNKYVIVSLPLTSVMDIAFKVGDSINTISYTPTISIAHIPVAIKFLHGNAAKTGLGVGMLSTKPTGGLEIGMDTFYYGDVQHNDAGVGVFYSSDDNKLQDALLNEITPQDIGVPSFPLSIPDGGTGAANASDARDNLGIIPAIVAAIGTESYTKTDTGANQITVGQWQVAGTGFVWVTCQMQTNASGDYGNHEAWIYRTRDGSSSEMAYVNNRTCSAYNGAVSSEAYACFAVQNGDIVDCKTRTSRTASTSSYKRYARVSFIGCTLTRL